MSHQIEAEKIEHFFTPPTELPQPLAPEALKDAINDYLLLKGELGADRMKESWLAIGPGLTSPNEEAGFKKELVFNAVFNGTSISPASQLASRSLELLLPYMTLPPRSDTVFTSGTDIERLTPNNTLKLGAILAESLKLQHTKLGERMPYWALSYILSHAAVEQKIFEKDPLLWTGVVAKIFEHLPETKNDTHPVLAPMFDQKNPAIQTLTRNTLSYMFAHEDFAKLRSIALRRVGMLEPSEASATVALNALQKIDSILYRADGPSEANGYYYDVALAAETAAKVCPSKAQPVSEKHLSALRHVIGTLPPRLDGTDLKKRLHASLGALYEFVPDETLREHIESLERENSSYIIQNLQHLIDHSPRTLTTERTKEDAPLWIPLVEEYIRREHNFPKHVAQDLSRACYLSNEEDYAYDLLRYASTPARGVLKQYTNAHAYHDAVVRFTRSSSHDVDQFLENVFTYSGKEFILRFFRNPIALRYLRDGIEYGLTERLTRERFETARLQQIDQLWEKASQNLHLLEALDKYHIDASRMTIRQVRGLLANASIYRMDHPHNISAALPHVEARFVYLALHDRAYTDPHRQILELFNLEQRRILNAPSTLVLVLADLSQRYNANAVLARHDDEFMNSLIIIWMRYVRIRGSRNVLMDIKQCAQSASNDLLWHDMVLRIFDASSPIYKRITTVKPYIFSPSLKESGTDAEARLKTIIEELVLHANEAKERQAQSDLIGPT